MTSNQSATWLIAPIAFWLITASANAKVVIDRYSPTDKFVSIKILGEIQYGEESSLEDAIETVQREKFNLKLNAVVLNTRGGNVDAALKMGRLIRKHGLNTYLAPNGECASACIFVLIGGITRMAFGGLSVDSERYYDSSGRQIGRADGSQIYDSSGRQIGRIDGERVYDSSGRQIGRIDGERLYSASGSQMGRIEGEHIYDGSGRQIGRGDGLRRM
jgi:hypothetical protein